MADDHAVAVEMMNRYSSQSSDNQRLMNYWTQPPTVVVEAASARSATSTASLGGRGRRWSALGRVAVRRPVVRRVAAASTRRRPPCRLRSGSRTRPAPHRRPAAVAVQARPRDPAAERRAVGPCRIGGGTRTGTRGRRSVRGHTGRPARDGSRNRRRPWRSRRGAANKRDPRRSPPGRRGPGAGAVGRWPRSDPSVGGGVRPVVPGPPARPGGAADWRTGLRTAPATPLDTAEPPARAPRTPAPGVGEPPPRAAVPPRKPPPSGWPRDARPPRATGSCRWAVRCGPRSRRTRGRPT